MANFFRLLLISSMIAVLFTALWNDPDDHPAFSDRPASIQQTPVSHDVYAGDSLAARGAALDALARYRAAEQQLSASTPPDADGLGWIWLRIAAALAQSDQPATAAAQFDMILEKMPDSPWAAQAHRHKGHMLAVAGKYREALPHFLRAVEHAQDEHSGQLAFQIAYCYQQNGQSSEAVTWYDRSLKTYPILGDYALYHTAQALKNLSPDEAFDRLRRLEREYTHSLFLMDARTFIFEYLLAGKRYDEAIAEARSRLQSEHALSSSDSAITFAQIGTAHDAAGRPDSAMAAYRIVLARYRTADSAIPALAAFRVLKERLGKQLTDEETLWSGLIYLNHREYGKAIQALERLVRASPPVSAEASYYLARSRYLAREYLAAEEGFRSFLKRYPEHDLAASAAFHVARSIRAIKGSSRSLDAYLAFADTYPDAPMAPDALLFVAQQMEEAGRLTDASKQYRRLADMYPDYKDADEARWLEGYCHYRVKRYEEAARVFQQLAREKPASSYAPRALYWSGKAAEKRNRTDEALARYNEIIGAYPSSYYAYQARIRTNEHHPLPSPLKKGTDPTAGAALPALDLASFSARFLQPDSTHSALVERIHLDRADALFHVGLREEGSREISAARNAYPDHPFILARATHLYFYHRYYREGIQAAIALRKVLAEQQGTEEDTVPVQFLYPAPFWSIVLEEAKKLEVDPLFLLAVMRQESRFDRWIVSWAGARGLMQLMPSTASSLARELKIKNYSLQKLYEPEINIFMGSQYLVQLLKQFNGRPELALAAYNGGPGRVARWIRQHGADDIDEFVEKISINETRHFVRAVMGNYAQYTLFMGGGRTGSGIESSEP